MSALLQIDDNWTCRLGSLPRPKGDSALTRGGLGGVVAGKVECSVKDCPGPQRQQRGSSRALEAAKGLPRLPAWLSRMMDAER